MDPALVNAISDVGLVGGAIYAVLGFMNGWIVPGKTYAKAEMSCQERIKAITDDFNARLARTETKLDAAAAVAERQSEANIKTIEALNVALARIEAK